jgi:hypothetical protein
MAVAGAITITSQSLGRGYSRFTLAWLSNAAGVVTEIPVTLPPGFINQVKFIPDAGGTQPTDLYDLTLIDAITGGADHLNGLGANLSNANRLISVPQVGASAVQRIFVSGDYYLTIANAGNAKGGQVILIIGP